MPYNIIKIKENCYMVISEKSGRIISYCTSLDKAKKQIKYLYSIEYKRRKKNINI